MKSQVEDHNKHKTSEGEFIYELENLYELSPKMSESIVESAETRKTRHMDLLITLKPAG